MICLYERESVAATPQISIEMPIMTEHGWATVVLEQDPANYALRGTRPTELRKRVATIDDCPEQPSAVVKTIMVPEFMTHRMWDSVGITVLD